MLVNTMLVGDPLHVPTLKAASTLGNNTIIQGFDQSRNLSATTNFYIGLRNLVLDTTAIDTSTEAVALNWPVSQACTLSNVHFNMPNYSSHVGVDMNGGGSGTIISDLVSLHCPAVEKHSLTASSLSPVEP
jgi:glucan 1,3-beta-glucosidase